jgi:carboxypeptidase family protein
MRTIATLVLATALAGCAGRVAAPSGGIEGTVTAGPTCPVERAGSPCPPAPWTGTVRATAADGTTREAVTDASGAYRLPLPDGTYVVTPVLQGGPPTATSVTVTVAGGAMQMLDLQVDTGIR